MKEFRDHNDASRYYSTACKNKHEEMRKLLWRMQNSSDHTKFDDFERLSMLLRELDTLTATFKHNLNQYRLRTLGS